jgi:hypothetical protein
MWEPRRLTTLWPPQPVTGKPLPLPIYNGSEQPLPTYYIAILDC